jgi:hypothetical protein
MFGSYFFFLDKESIKLLVICFIVKDNNQHIVIPKENQTNQLGNTKQEKTPRVTKKQDNYSEINHPKTDRPFEVYLCDNKGVYTYKMLLLYDNTKKRLMY